MPPDILAKKQIIALQDSYAEAMEVTTLLYSENH